MRFLGVNNTTVSQLIRFGIVGLASNFIGYIIYILVTYLGIAPKIAMTILYGIGTGVSYFGNKKFTFSDMETLTGPGLRYLISTFFGYVVNFMLLYVFSDLLGYPHQLVQAAAIFIVAIVLFVAFKYYVFKRES